MKAYKKSKLDYENGYIMKDDKVVVVNPMVVGMLNKLDLDLQKSRFENAKAELRSSIDELNAIEFEPETERVKVSYDVETPTLDKQVEWSVKLMKEIDACNGAAKAEEYIKSIDEAVQFVHGKKVLDYKNFPARQFDLPTIGNPLELDVETLIDLVKSLFE